VSLFGHRAVRRDEMPKPEMYSLVDLSKEASGSATYDNHPVADVNDHVVRVSIMTEPFHWHLHPNSDESFLVLEGKIRIEFPGCEIELSPGQLLTVRRGILHRTAPIGDRSINLTFERADMETIAVEPGGQIYD
jgi:mannose-6-phosphate isomerase-like protein (cupin superfamily)